MSEPCPPDKMIRRVIFLPESLYERACRHIEAARTDGSLLRLPELVRRALHGYLVHQEEENEKP